MPSDDVVLSASALRTYARATLDAVGAPEDIAAAVADHLVEANLTGYDSHGLHLLPVYLEDVRNGEIIPSARPLVIREGPAHALVSGERGFGQATGAFAMDVAIRIAGQSGIAIVGIERVHHLGRMGHYAEQANRAGCASMTFTSGLGGAIQAAPYGGTRSTYGANPISAGFAASGDADLVVDYATTAVAGGKVMLARTAGVPLPTGVLVDQEGKPTTDPEDMYRGGSLLPFGGHKGYALALFCELMGRVLVGSDTGSDAVVWGDRFGRSGATFIAIRQDVFRRDGEAATAAAATFAHVRRSPAADPASPVRTPGEREARTRRERAESGIRLPRGTVEALASAAERVGTTRESIAPLREALTRR